jgi:hypothetical protein
MWHVSGIMGLQDDAAKTYIVLVKPALVIVLAEA